MWAGIRKQVALAGPVEFTILAGISQGQPNDEIDSIIDSAKFNQKEIWMATMCRRGVNI